MHAPESPRAPWWREPLVHFAVLGGLLLVLDLTVEPAMSDAGEGVGPIHVRQGHLEELRQALRLEGKEATAHEIQEEVDRFVDEEILVREALRLGLDRGDVVIRRRLVQKMAFLLDDLAEAQAPTEAEVAAWLAEHPERFRRPARYDLEHVYFSSERRGASAAADATTALAGWTELRQDPVGDPFLGGTSLKRRTAVQLDRGFGPAFAAAVMDADPGSEHWTGPAASTYGAHLVRVTRAQPTYVPELDEAYDAVRLDLLDERRRRASGEARAELRERYPVMLEETP